MRNKATAPARHELPAVFTYTGARAAGLSAELLYAYRDRGLVEQIGRGLAERSLVDVIRLRHREGPDVAWEALRRWLRRKGAKPASLIEMAKSLHGAERAVRNALEIVL